MSNELESVGAMAMNLESSGVDGVGYDHDETETEPPGTSDKPALKIMFQVTQIVRFLLERGLRFRNLVFLRTWFDVDSDSDLQSSMHL
jgi:hypothetical protein